jgi:hypothetical protein
MWELTGTWRQGTVTWRIDVLPGTMQSPGGVTCYTQRSSMTITDTVPDGTVQDVTDLLVDAYGETLYGSITGQTVDWVVQRQGNIMPTPYGIGAAKHQLLTFTSGKTQDSSSRIDSAERVTTAAGTFDCWKAYVTGTIDGFTMLGNQWFAPDVGPVRRTVTFTNPALEPDSVQIDVTLARYSIH